MKKNQIKVRRIRNNTKTIFTIKNGMVYNMGGRRNVYCSCTGNTVETATPMQYKDGEVFCPHCHEKKVEVLQTYEEWKSEQEEKDKKRNAERLANLHLVEVGSDWECGLKYYGLSAQIEYDDWLKVKEHFRYYRKGWSRGQELEWNYGEPTGWLTRNPSAVEDILVEVGLIKQENTMDSIRERDELEKQRRAEELNALKLKRDAIKEKMDIIDSKIQNVFDVSEKRELSDAEASEHYFNADFGKGTVCTFRIVDGEIVKCENMGDFKYGVAIPYSKDVEDMLGEVYSLNDEFWSLLN